MGDVKTMADKEVYDQAKQHFKGKYPDSLPIEQAYLHIGMYLGWVIHQQLYSSFFEDEAGVQIIRFKKNELSCIILCEIWDGYLGGDLLNEEGNAFTRSYYASGRYLEDYKTIVARDLATIYHVKDTPENFQLLARQLDQRLLEWRAGK